MPPRSDTSIGRRANSAAAIAQRDRSGEKRVITYPFAVDPDRGGRGYGDPEKTDFAPNIRAALESVVDPFNERLDPGSGKPYTADPKIEIMPVDLYAAYAEGMRTMEKRLRSSGFMDRAPAPLKVMSMPIVASLGLSYVERRHIIENANYKRQDRSHLERFSDAGRKALASRGFQIPLLSSKLERNAAENEEAELVYGRKLFEYAIKRLREESLAVASAMTPASRNAAELVDDWKLSFSSAPELEAFFKKTFGTKAPALDKRTEIDALVRQARALLGEANPPDLPAGEAGHAQVREFRTRTEVREHFAAIASDREFRGTLSRGQANALKNLRLDESTLLQLRTDKALEGVPMHEEILARAKNFRQTEWDLGLNPKIIGKPSQFRFPDGSTCTRLNAPGENPKFSVMLGDGSRTLTFTRKDSGEFGIQLKRGESDTAPVYDETHEDFDRFVGADFHRYLLKALFGDRPMTRCGSFHELYGRVRAGLELENRIENTLYKGVDEAISARFDAVGRPIVFQAGGNSYNKGLYGVNWGTEDRARTIEAVFRMAGRGDVFAHGSCGFHQESEWAAGHSIGEFGGVIFAKQDGGKTYRYDECGGDPYDGQAFRTYMRVKPYTDTAGVNEKKIPAVLGGDFYQWATRSVKPLAVSVIRATDAQGTSEVSDMVLRDDRGRPIVASEGLRCASATDLDGQVLDFPRSSDDPPAFDPLRVRSVTLRSELDEGMVLADDLGRPVEQVDGTRVNVPEELTLETRLDGNPITTESLEAARRRLRAELAAEPTPRTLESRVDAALRSKVTFAVTRAERWERIPLTEEGPNKKTELSKQYVDADGNIQSRLGEFGSIPHTYRRVKVANPRQEQLLDYASVQIHCVHGQNARNLPYTDELSGDHLVQTGFGVPRGGVEADPILKSLFVSGANRRMETAGMYVPPGTRQFNGTVEAAEGLNIRHTQPHTDMHLHEAKADDPSAVGEDPLVRHQIENAVAEQNQSIRDGIKGALQSGLALRDKQRLEAELKSALAPHREWLDSQPHDKAADFLDRERTDWEYQGQALLDRIRGLELELRDMTDPEARGKVQQELNSANFQYDLLAADRLGVIRLNTIAPRTESAQHPILTPPSRAQRPIVTPPSPTESALRPTPLRRTVPATTTGPASVLPAARPIDEIEVMRRRLDSLEEAVPRVAEAVEDLQAEAPLGQIIQRYFRPWNRVARPDRWALSTGARTTSAVSDLAEGARAVADATRDVHAFEGLSAFTFLGSFLLGAAGVEGMKEATIDRRRLQELSRPLQEYRDALEAAKAVLDGSLRAGSGGTAEMSEPLRAQLEGMNARLDAVNRQLIDRTLSLGTSGLLAAAGSIGVAGGFASLFPSEAANHGSSAGGFIDRVREGAEASGSTTHFTAAGIAAKSLSAAYGGVVGIFGAATAIQGTYRLRQLQGLPAAVERRLGKDSALRYNLQIMLGHERESREGEIAARTVLAAAGFTSLGLNAAALANHWNPGALLAIPGVALGLATAAAFRPVRSRQRGLQAVGGVERTTGLTIFFLNSTNQLSHLASKLNNQTAIASHFHRELIQDKLNDPGEQGFDQFRHTYRATRAATVLLPSQDRRTLAARIVARPQEAADSLLGYMTRMNKLELDYLLHHKVPGLFDEIQELLESKKHIADEQTRNNLDPLIEAKARYCATESARLNALQALDDQLQPFSRHLGKSFLDDEAVKKAFHRLQVDFIIAHDMTSEALTREEVKALEALPASGGDREAAMRDKLADGIERRFADIFTRSHLDKVAYERVGALVIARMMFMLEKERDAAPAPAAS